MSTFVPATRPPTVVPPAEFAEPTGRLTLRQAMAAALLGNPELRSQAYGVRVAEAKALQASLGPNPEVGLEWENFGGTAGGDTFASSEVTLSLSQSFPLGGDVKSAHRQAKFDAGLAGWDYESARVSLLAEVARQYVEVLAAQRRLELAERRQRLAQRVAESIDRRVAAGQAPAVERSRSAVPAAEAQLALARARRELASARIQLAVTWGSFLPGFGEVVGDLDTLPALPSAEAVAALVGQNPDVARWTVEIASRQAEVERSRAQATPDLTAALGYRWFNEDDEGAFVAGLSIPLTVVDRGQGDILAARFGVASARERQRAVQLRVQSAIARSYAELANAHHEAVGLRDLALPPAEQSNNDVRRAFESGTVGLLDLLDAERTLADLHERYIEALVAAHAAAADLEAIIGQSLDSIPTSHSNPDSTQSVPGGNP